MLSLLFLAGCATPGATGPKVAGDYAGKWSGSDGMAGDVRMNLAQAGGAWNAKVVISAQGDTIPTSMDSVTVDQTKVELVYHFEAEGTNSKVTMTGQLQGAVLAGDYQVTSTKNQKVTATGTWSMTRGE